MARYDPVPQLPPPMTPDDLYALRFLMDAQISPDGARVAFAVRTANEERDGYRSALWLVPADGSSDARQLTFGPGQDTLPRWSPDGSTLAFVSNRTDDRERNTVADIHVANASGRNGWRVTDGVGAYGNPRFSPDGSSVACYGVAKALGSAAKNVKVFLFPSRGDGRGQDL